jgi:uncharacterized membrane protein
MRESVPFGVRRSAFQTAFVAATVTWTAMLPLAPFVASHARDSVFATGFAASIYAIGHVICHQLPARSYQLFATPLPVCARCTGIYLGAAIAAVIAAAVRAPPRRATGVTTRTARLALVAAALPTAITLVFEWTTGVTPSNTIRLMAGAPIGIAVAWLVARSGL